MSLPQLALLGLGHMGQAFVTKAAISGYPMHNVCGYDPLKHDVPVVYTVPTVTYTRPRTIVCVKPPQVRATLQLLTKPTHLISAAACISVAQLAAMSPVQHHSITRVMGSVLPGIPTYWYSPDPRYRLTKFFPQAVRLQTEEELDHVTVISSCMPAIAGSYMQLLIVAAQRSNPNMDPAVVERIVYSVLQATLPVTAAGGLPQLIRHVATPGGLTHAALLKLNQQQRHIVTAMQRTLAAGYSRLAAIKRDY